jgi:uncharacterized membrane protein YphA (DoxX/SURF4 family)
MTLRHVTQWPRRHAALWVWLLRAAVGATFAVSGIAKLIDQWGFVYKIEQYLSVWGVNVPRTLELTGGIILSGVEFSLGLLLLLGCFRRGVPALLTLVMAFMLPLSLYIAVANPVADCGCFGDLIKISNPLTLAKNVALTMAVVALLFHNRKAPCLYAPYSQWVVAFVIGAYALTVALIGYNVQPMIDFRGYPVGSTLIDPDETSADDGDMPVYVYTRDGATRGFTPDDLPDSTWTFVERVEPSHHAATKAGRDFAIYDGDDDVTADELSADGPQLLVLIPDLRRADISYTYLINELNSYMESRGGSMIGIIATDAAGIDWWTDCSMAQYPCYTADDTAIKELVRGNVGLVYTERGKIVWKRSIWSVPTDITEISRDPLKLLAFDGPRLMRQLTGCLLAALLMIDIVVTIMKRLHRRGTSVMKLLFKR